MMQAPNAVSDSACICWLLAWERCLGHPSSRQDDVAMPVCLLACLLGRRSRLTDALRYMPLGCHKMGGPGRVAMPDFVELGVGWCDGKASRHITPITFGSMMVVCRSSQRFRQGRTWGSDRQNTFAAAVLVYLFFNHPTCRDATSVTWIGSCRRWIPSSMPTVTIAVVDVAGGD